MIKSGRMNESAQLINESASNEKDIAKLKKMYARQLEIQDFIVKNGFEAAMKYKDEFHKLTGDIGKLAQKIDGPGAIHGKGILYYIDKEMNKSSRMNEAFNRHPKLGKKVKQLKGWKIYQGTDSEGMEVFRCFTPDDDYPAVGYEDWETDTLDAAISWIKNY